MVGERTSVRVLAALPPAAMLAVDPWGWYPFGPLKWALVSALGVAGAALVLRDRLLRVDRPVALAALALVAWLALAAALGEDPLYAWIGTPERRFGVLTWALCALLLAVGSSLDADRDGPVLVRGLLVAGLGVGAVATAEALGWEPEVLDVGSRLTGTFGSSAYLGAGTALLLPIAVGVALGVVPDANPSTTHRVPVALRRRARGVAWVASALLTIACLGSGARAAWVGLAASALIAGHAVREQVFAAVRAHRRRVALGAAAAVVVTIGVLALSPVGSRLADLTDDDSAGGRGRLDEWAVAVDVVADHPLVGVGPEGYRTVFHEHVDRAYAVEHGREVQPDRAHDGPLDLAVAGGLPALLAWFVLAACVGRAIWSALRDGPGWQRGLAAGLVAHWVGQLRFFPVVELEPVAWLLAGLVVAAARTPRDLARAHASRVQPIRARTRGVVVGRLAVGAVAAVVSGATEIVADHRADDAAAALARGDGRAAADAAESAADLRPDVVRLQLLAARAALAADQGFQAALGHVDEALDVAPHDPVAELARLTYLVGRAEATRTAAHIDTASRALAQRLDEDRNDPRLWDLAARVAALRGDGAKADGARRQAEALTPEEER